MIKFFLLIFSFIIYVGPLNAGTVLEKPKGNVILTISGNILNTNTSQTLNAGDRVDPTKTDITLNESKAAEFDLEMLVALKQTIIHTETPWTDNISSFEGPSIRDIMTYLGASGDYIDAIALNGYKITIPLKDVNYHSVILALKQDDKILSVRKRGPSWVIYPWSDKPELRKNVYYTRSIWQLKSLVIR